ncbi:MAG: hypothetical protein ABIL22_08625, partial [candidate division WOR-3 bacterium]
MKRDRIAMFSCIPPAHSGIAEYTRNVVKHLAENFEIDVFIGEKPAPAEANNIFHHVEFAWKNVRDPYQVIIYQMGNNEIHDFEYSYIGCYPGILVLHDIILYQARSKYLLKNSLLKEYEEEMRYCHGYSGSRMAQISLKYPIPPLVDLNFSMNKLLIENSLAVGVHT